jgi:geranylgeranyl diphosphate synthase type I
MLSLPIFVCEENLVATDRQLVPYLDAIENELHHVLGVPNPALAPLYHMMQYHLGWLDEQQQPVKASRGKRLRPLLCLLACQAAGADWRTALPAAASLELIHNFSLIHDDIEDNSATRRHRPTVWKLWGLAQGINTGDAMWALARSALQRLATNSLVPLVILEIYTRVDDACRQLCHGQYLDLAFETSPNVSLADYEQMITGKTAALIAACTAIGAVVAGVAPNKVMHYYSFGLELGLAFQIQDDILGIWGDPAITGKSAADDILSKKKTYPILTALAWEQDQGLHDLADLNALPVFGPAELEHAFQLLKRANAQKVAQQRVQASLAATLEHLARAECTQPAGNMLRELALNLVQRST